MARVNHKRVKQLLNEKRSRITDRQFFTSRILAGHFEDMAMAQTRRYKYNRRVHVAIRWSPKSGEVACTNNLSVLINAGHRLVTQNRGRESRYEIVCGLGIVYTRTFLRARPTTTASAGRNGIRSRLLTSCPKTL